MSKFAAALKAHQTEPIEAMNASNNDDAVSRIGPDTKSTQTGSITAIYQSTPELVIPRRLGRPTGKRSDADNTQVTGYVPAQLYYDVRIKLMERKRRDRRAKGDFSDLLREWMERWLAEQP